MQTMNILFLRQLHARAVAPLQRKGISTEGYYSKSWHDLPVTRDIVITVGGSAAGETCPACLALPEISRQALDAIGC